MVLRKTATRGVMTTAAILLLLFPVTMWAGTFEAPAFVQADETGAFSFEIIYTPGPRECFDYEGVSTINTTVETFNGDGFCTIPLDACVPYSVGSGGALSGSLVDPTAVGIVEVNFGTACEYWQCWTPPPTPVPPATPTPTPTAVPGCPTIPGGGFSALVQVVPFGWPTPTPTPMGPTPTPTPTPALITPTPRMPTPTPTPALITPTPRMPTPTPGVTPTPSPIPPIQGEIKAKVHLKFNKPSKDKIGVKVKNWTLPMGVVPTDVTVNVGGAEFTGTLDAKGKFKSPDGRDSIKLKQSKKTQLWKITVKRKNNDFAADLGDEGLTNADNPKPGLPVIVPLTIEVGGGTYSQDVNLFYKSKLGKKGTAK